MTNTNVNLQKIVQDAAEFHGHLGPFLVVGVKMGLAAIRTLGTDGLQGKVAVRLLPPFSCVIDGVQFATHCTVGNRRLSVENSDDTIMGEFAVADSGNSLRISARSEFIKQLTGELSEGTSLEKLAWKVATLSDEEIFRTKSLHS